jgi:hypothetical protein
MAQSTLSSVVPKKTSFEASIKSLIATLVYYINLMFTELYDDVTIPINVHSHASKTVHNLFTARRGYTVTAIDFTPDVAQGATLTATLVKVVGTATPAAGTTPMCTAGAINCNGTAHTVQSVALTSTAADLVLAAGNRIGLVLSGALSTGSGQLTIRMRRTGT